MTDKYQIPAHLRECVTLKLRREQRDRRLLYAAAINVHIAQALARRLHRRRLACGVTQAGLAALLSVALDEVVAMER